MRNLKLIAYSIIIVTSLFITSCSKNKAFRNEDGQSTIDNREAQSENDAAVNDVNDVIGNQAKLHGRSTEQNQQQTVTGTICGMTLDTASLKQGSVKLNYDGTTCNNRTRTGSIIITIQDYTTGKRWRDPGCVLKVEYQAYKIVRASDGKSIQLDGTQYLTNETGGTWWELLIVKSKTSLSHAINGTNLKVTFEDGKTATYNINRRVTYTFPNNVITCKAEGTGSSDGLSSLENYGTTRDGDAFTSQVTTPIIWNLTCGFGAPIQGEVNIKVASKDFDLKCLFAVDKNGDPVTVAANQCAYGWKIEWTHKSKTKNKVIGYK